MTEHLLHKVESRPSHRSERPTGALLPREMYAAAGESPELQNPTLDLSGIFARRDEVESFINSGFMQEYAADTSPQRRDHARKDYFDAISAADRVPKSWVSDQYAALADNIRDGHVAYEKAFKNFRSGVDALPGPTRVAVNGMLHKLKNAYNQEGAGAWQNHPELVNKIAGMLPLDLLDDFRQMEELDKRRERAIGAADVLSGLESAPITTRTIAARFLAGQGDIEGSRDLLNQILKLNPDLKDSPIFATMFESPKLMAEMPWGGPGALRPPAPTNPLEELFKHLAPVEPTEKAQPEHGI
jgi:hypothetical protein